MFKLLGAWIESRGFNEDEIAKIYLILPAVDPDYYLFQSKIYREMYDVKGESYEINIKMFVKNATKPKNY